MSKSEDKFDHSEFVIRNKDNLREHLNGLSHGVVNRCPLNDLNFYSFVDSPSVDIMHDILEGVVPFEIKIVLQKLISLGGVTLNIINDRLLAHDYG